MLMINNKSRIFILWVTAMIATIGLTGCVKAEISVDVKQNGSGTLSMAIGITQQAKALASNQGSDPIQEMKKAFAESTGEAQDVKVTTWIDGDYEWAKAEKEFANLDEINNAFTENKAFNKFFLARNRSLFRDEFMIDAEFAPLDGGSAAGNDFGVDPSTVIQLSFSLRLPGKIIETNGLRDKNDPNRIVWDVESKQAVSIKARSMSWNWINIFIIAGLLLLFGIVALGGVGYFVYARSKKNKVLKGGEPTQNLPIQEADFIADLGIEKLLLEINTKVLNSVGEIHKRQGGIALVWKDVHSRDMTIDVRELEGNNISINDQVYSATTEDTRSGIIAALRKEVRK